MALYAFIIVGPLGFLRGPLVLERMFWYLRALLPTGMMARSVRVAIDWRLGNFDVAIAQAEEVVAHVESYYEQKKDSRVRRQVLEDLYTLLTRAYMHAGHMDEAMQVILRAKRDLGVERLPGLADLDAKTAHLVRAGLAAGKLLEGGGLATMFIKADTRTHRNSERGNENGHESNNERSRQRPQSTSIDGHNEEPRGAKIIPFPPHDHLV